MSRFTRSLVALGILSLLDCTAQQPVQSRVALGAPPARADSVIAGRVLDSSGRPQPNVSVVATATRRQGGARLEATTNAAGQFMFRGLEPGQRYLVLATATQSPVALIGRVAATPPDQHVTIEIARPFTANRTAIEIDPGAPKARPGTSTAAAIPLPQTADRSSKKSFFDQNPFAATGTSSDRPAAGPIRPQPTRRTREQVIADNRLESPWDMPAPSARKASPQPTPQTAPSDTADSPWRPAGSNRPIYHGTKLGHAILDTNSHREEPSDSSAAESDHGPADQPATADPSRPLSQPIEIAEPRRNDRPHATLNKAVVRPENQKQTSEQSSEARSPTDMNPNCRFDSNKLVDFRLPGIDEQPVSFSEANGQLVLLDFWATWCVPCLKGIPNLAGLQRKYGPQGLQVIGVNCEQGVEKERVARTTEVRDQLGINYPLAFDGSGDSSLKTRFGVSVFPTLILLDKSGRVLWRSDGPDQRDYQQLEKLLKSQLNSSASRYN